MLYLIVNTAMYSMKYGIVMYEVQYNPLSAPWQSLYGIVKYEVQYNPLSLLQQPQPHVVQGAIQYDTVQRDWKIWWWYMKQILIKNLISLENRTIPRKKLTWIRQNWRVEYAPAISPFPQLQDWWNVSRIHRWISDWSGEELAGRIPMIWSKVGSVQTVRTWSIFRAFRRRRYVRTGRLVKAVSIWSSIAARTCRI